MRNRLYFYLLSVIKGKRRGIMGMVLRAFLHLPSLCFCLIAHLRNFLYDRKIRSHFSAPVPLVISIGNIVAGGTGKTPFTLLLAEEFYKKHAVAILSRGYCSPAESLKQPLLVSQGNGPLYPASYCGDEPYLLADNLPQSIVVAGKNRKAAALLAVSQGAEVILLDDGMQHRRLARDFDIAVVNAQDPFGGGYFLPRGLLREGAASLSRAHLIVVNHVASSEQFAALQQMLRPFTQAAMIGTRTVPFRTLLLSTRTSTSIQGKSIGMLSSIANPDHFLATLSAQEATVVDQYCVPDHMPFSAEQLHLFSDKCKQQGAEFLACTEKDAVKLPQLETSLPIAVVHIRLQIVEGLDRWQQFITETKMKILQP